jgi:hypothetical protein
VRLTVLPLFCFVLAGLPSYSPAQGDPGVDLLSNGSFDSDGNRDGWPDAWFDYHGARTTDGGRAGSKCLELSSDDLALRARCQQGFPIDGSTVRWIEFGAWATASGVQRGETQVDTPAIRLTLFNAHEEAERLEAIRLPTSPFGWCHFAKAVRVPQTVTHALFTPTLGGATGRLCVDDVYVRAAHDPYAGGPELLLNPSFEWGGAVPDHWRTARAQRLSPGCHEQAAVRVGNGWVEQDALLPEGTAQVALGMWLRSDAEALTIARVALHNEWGRPGPDIRKGTRQFAVQCRTDWAYWESGRIGVPPWAAVATVRVECPAGACELDSVSLRAYGRNGDPVTRPGAYAPDVARWPAYSACESEQDDQPGAQLPPVRVQEGHFVTTAGERVRFWGAQLAGSDCFLTEDEALSLCRNLRARGFNLVVLRDLCWPSETGRSLVSPYSQDTLSLYQPALRKLDHLCALLAQHGIYYALELGGGRPFREGDGIAACGELPSGGGAAAYFGPRLVELQKRHASALLGYRNPETGLRYADDPAVAWVSLTRAEPPLALADALFPAAALPEPYASALEERFRTWLLDRYGSEQRLREVWGAADLGELLPGPAAVDGTRQRDTIAFLHHVQGEFLREMTGAVREIGFGGPISGGLQYLSLPADLESKARCDLVELLTADTPRPPAGPFVASSLCFPGQDAASLAAVRQVLGCPTVVVNAGAWAASEEVSALALLSAAGAALDWDGLVIARIAPAASLWGDGPHGGPAGQAAGRQPVPTNSHPLLVELLPLARRCFVSGQPARAGLAFLSETDPRPLTAVGLHAYPVSGGLGSPVRVSFREEDPVLPAAAPLTRAQRPISLGDLTWDWQRGRWAVVGKGMCLLGGVMDGSLLPVGPFLVKADSRFAVFAAVSEDGLALEESHRIRLSLLGSTEAEGALYADRSLRCLLSPGEPPMRLAPIAAHVSLRRPRSAPRLSASRLDWDGRPEGRLHATYRATSVELELPAQGHYQLVAE